MKKKRMPQHEHPSWRAIKLPPALPTPPDFRQAPGPTSFPITTYGEPIFVWAMATRKMIEALSDRKVIWQ
jgi:hypothetical protein